MPNHFYVNRQLPLNNRDSDLLLNWLSIIVDKSVVTTAVCIQNAQGFRFRN